jgi:hypothetical protein
MEGVRVGVMPHAFPFLSTGTGEPDNAKVFCPVRRGTGRKGSNDLARGLPYLVERQFPNEPLQRGVLTLQHTQTLRISNLYPSNCRRQRYSVCSAILC